MTLWLSDLARQDLEEIRAYTVERWGRAKWLSYYRDITGAFSQIEANPMAGRPRDLFRPAMRSVNCGQHIIFFLPIKAAGGQPVVIRILHQRRHLAALSYYDDLDGG